MNVYQVAWQRAAVTARRNIGAVSRSELAALREIRRAHARQEPVPLSGKSLLRTSGEQR